MRFGDLGLVVKGWGRKKVSLVFLTRFKQDWVRVGGRLEVV